MSDADTAAVSQESIKTAPFDARFPNTNQTKHCWQEYVDYQKCIKAKGEDYEPCKQFFRSYSSLCPNDWVMQWDEMRDEGRSPFNLNV
ncbi:cytochrome c oxidase, subunit VIb [Syncephalis fuscata]|nr:cytochrome c oxidase, subunit VIb [Syncephalis fuscata]